MVQPLSNVCSDAQVEISADCIGGAPDFAEKVMRVIALWSHNDGNLAAILAVMLKTDIQTGVAMYHALTSAEARKAALFAAADIAMLEWEAILLRAVIRACRASRNQRNDFAHGIWGVSPDVPDAIMLLDAEVVMEHNVSVRQPVMVDGQRVIRPKGIDNKRVWVYRQKDFDAAHDDAQTAYQRLLNYYTLARFRDDRARIELLSDPQVAQAAHKLSRESSPATQAQLRPPTDGEEPPEGYVNHPAADLFRNSRRPVED